MAKSETITTRAPGSGKKTPAKASHSTTAKAKPAGTARKATSSKAGAARKATTSKKGEVLRKLPAHISMAGREGVSKY